MNLIIKRFVLNKNFSIYFSVKHSCLFMKHILGISYFFLPSYFFWKTNLKAFQLIFINLRFFKSFFINLKLCFHTYLIYFLKLKIRGLGYRLRSITDNCHYFFFNYTNYYYFFNPKSLIVKTYKKRMLLLSFNWWMLKVVLSHILLLRKMGPYTLHGLRLVKQIVFLKKSGKKL